MHEHLSKLGKPIDNLKDKNGDPHIIWEYIDLSGIIEKFRKSHQGEALILSCGTLAWKCCHPYRGKRKTGQG